MAQSTCTSGNLQSFLRLLDEKGVTPEIFGNRLSSGVLADVFDPNADLSDRIAVRKALKLGANLSNVFRLTADHDQSLEQMIVAGRYDWKNSDITGEHFPSKGRGKIEFEARYFHFNRNISSKNAVEKIKAEDPANPWAPAQIVHLLAHGATNPEEQRKYPIVGLGSVALVCGRRDVPYLNGNDAKRNLGLHWWSYDWAPIYRFLAVRRVSAPQA